MYCVMQAYGMFVWNAQTRAFWFNHLSIDTEQDFSLVGMILGLAIYNGVILDVHFPLVVFKKLLNKQPDFQVPLVGLPFGLLLFGIRVVSAAAVLAAWRLLCCACSAHVLVLFRHAVAEFRQLQQHAGCRVLELTSPPAQHLALCTAKLRPQNTSPSVQQHKF